MKDKTVEAFRLNGIERVLIIDDAYDPPDLDSETFDFLADFITGDEVRAVCEELRIEPSTIDEAVNSVDEGDSDNIALNTIYRALYEKYVQTGESRFDIGERFSILKEPALAILRLLECYLNECGEAVQVKKVGIEDAVECFFDFRPQILILDYYLSDEVPGEGRVSGSKMTKARGKSYELLGELVDSNDLESRPSIILMSSRKVRNIDQFRYVSADLPILSLRFGFLHKKLVRKEDQNVIVEGSAAEALLDASQGYIFSNQIEQALFQWKKGTESALIDFLKEVGRISLKDYAYLIRFRLQDENQPFSDYLEWFFGESLKGWIEEKVDWNHASFSSLADDKKTGGLIGSAFEGPSDIIAKLFHRVRVYGRRKQECIDYRLGDLYVQNDKQTIRAVITPDCDLVVRNGQRKAKNILTLVGKLDRFDTKNCTADDFLIREGSPYSVSWDKKLETFPIQGETSLIETAKMEYWGTLRPMYSQEIQSRVIKDLSRVGLPVSPAFGINVPATIWIKYINGYQQIKTSAQSVATIVPPRAGKKDVPRVLLRRRSLNDLMDELREIDLEEVNQGHRNFLKELQKKDGTNKLHDVFLEKGGRPINKETLGTGFVIGSKPKEDNSSPWLQIALDTSKSEIDYEWDQDSIL